jgi:hypothetical protein
LICFDGLAIHRLLASLSRARLDQEPRLQTVMDTKAFRPSLYPPQG